MNEKIFSQLTSKTQVWVTSSLNWAMIKWGTGIPVKLEI